MNVASIDINGAMQCEAEPTAQAAHPDPYPSPH